ncbi:MgPa adhesin [Mycoplasmoides genitalium M2288]|nr:MgPa adhesin [Mycoplasmoides genitalium M2288]
MKSGQYQQNNTYNKLIEPESATSAATNMTNLLKLLSSKNIKQKLGKTAQSQENSGGGLVKRLTPLPLREILVAMEPLKRLIRWKVIKNHQ